jgi:hypothetical protein
MIEEDKVSLVRRRAELVDRLAEPLPADLRIQIQGELSVVNAKIKAINTTQAAQLKATADRRKVAGLAEARMNAERARAKAGGDDADDDPGQTTAIDTWIVAVLRRGGVKVRVRDGAVLLDDAPAKWVAIVDALREGIHAAARGEELPEIAAATTTRKRS